MKIVKCTTRPWVEVAFKPGDVFRYPEESSIWIVTDEKNNDDNFRCVNLATGEISHGWGSLMVEPLPLAQVVV